MAPGQQQNYTMTRMGAVSLTQGVSRIYVGGPGDKIRGCRAAVTVFIPARHLGPGWVGSKDPSSRPAAS